MHSPRTRPPRRTVRTGSEQLIAELAREAQLAQLSTLDSLDTKAAQLIGFAGIVFGLIFTSGIAGDAWNVGLAAGAILLAFATVAFGAALLPRGFRFSPNIAALDRTHLGIPPNETAAAVVESVVRALTWNSDLLSWKARSVQFGTIFAVLGLVVAGAGLLYAVIGEGG